VNSSLPASACFFFNLPGYFPANALNVLQGAFLLSLFAKARATQQRMVDASSQNCASA
jgi:hypothetical protein